MKVRRRIAIFTNKTRKLYLIAFKYKCVFEYWYRKSKLCILIRGRYALAQQTLYQNIIFPTLSKRSSILMCNTIFNFLILSVKYIINVKVV